MPANVVILTNNRRHTEGLATWLGRNRKLTVHWAAPPPPEAAALRLTIVDWETFWPTWQEGFVSGTMACRRRVNRLLLIVKGTPNGLALALKGNGAKIISYTETTPKGTLLETYFSVVEGYCTFLCLGPYSLAPAATQAHYSFQVLDGSTILLAAHEAEFVELLLANEDGQIAEEDIPSLSGPLQTRQQWRKLASRINRKVQKCFSPIPIGDVIVYRKPWYSLDLKIRPTSPL